jgi:hypothetical protein
VEFFFPQAHADIDWPRGIEFLDTELQQIQRVAEQGLRIVDKLVRVWRRVATLVVLADENHIWRPREFGYELWDCRIRFEFPTAKLLDLAKDWERLVSHQNPFALLVMAYLKAKEFRNGPDVRLSWKVRFVRGLHEHGWSRLMVLDVFHTIDWFLALPPNLELQFHGELKTIEAEKHIPYVTSIERIAKQEDHLKGRVEAHT